MPKSNPPGGRVAVFDRYADVYDFLYADKNYKGEVDFVVDIIGRHAEAAVATVLDVGCGTGRHLIDFARAGLKATGFDVSRHMIGHARRRISRAAREESSIRDNLPVARVADVRSFLDGKEYDCVVSMFAVMGYLTTNEDLLAALQNIRRHMKERGLFVFDVWFGPAVLTQKPETRVRDFYAEGLRTIRLARPEPDYLRNLVIVHYTILQLKGQQIVAETHEAHAVRFFFVPELQFLLQNTGFTTVKICPFMEMDREPNVTDWNITVVAKAV